MVLQKCGFRVSARGKSMLRVWLLFGLTALVLGRMTVLAGMCAVFPGLIFPLSETANAPAKRVGQWLLAESVGFAVCVGLLRAFRVFSWSVCFVPLLAGALAALADKVIRERGLFPKKREAVRALVLSVAFASCFIK